ncbi:hypothetical protein ACJH6J_30400 [Mycobacterium sp. SMC-18]|uniref:hypothetical protein n=1 Tax=Mycobacterium sp. SMC-18 TaxID=3381629 RepID=UPI0038765E7E
MALDPFKPNRELGGEPSDYCAACLCEWRMYQDEHGAWRFEEHTRAYKNEVGRCKGSGRTKAGAGRD